MSGDNYPGVMISSTFLDLEDHRRAMEKAIQGQKLMPVIMENDGAKADVDIIGSSLDMVRNSAGYVLIIGQKYGQTPECKKRNPNNLSVTELEFEEALKQGHPILLFIMDDKHLLSKDQIEKDPIKEEKLNAFRERAKKFGPDSGVERVYASFKNLEEFKELANKSIPNLKNTIESKKKVTSKAQTIPIEEEFSDGSIPIPSPPALYAQPPYISNSDQFVGRRAELESIDDWAKPADTHPVLLFDAIGGSGKSALTWEWTTNNAKNQEWAGIFWYSFYERGAQMSDFCQHALAYMTGKPVEDFYKLKTPKLAEMLLGHLQEKPWLLILDGLERVLVAYNRIDAAQMLDEAADSPTDEISKRDPIACIRTEDDDLLRRLAGANPSKILISTRLVPKVLINKANQPIHGVVRKSLGGLRPPDAEALIRSNGVHGDSDKIQEYLQTTCNCHPLVTGVLAGLINDYLPDRGNFDKWHRDPDFGGSLNLADLDLVQKRNHIVKFAIDSLPPASKQLLAILSMLSTSVDYTLLQALDPNQPSDPKILSETIKDLERRGLVQYDQQTRRHDLHPVVRGIASGNLDSTEKETHGNRIVEHLSSLKHKPFEEAETFEDLATPIHVVTVQITLGRFWAAYQSNLGLLFRALQNSLESYAEIVAIAKAFFPDGWDVLPKTLSNSSARAMCRLVAAAFQALHENEKVSLVSSTCIASALEDEDWDDVMDPIMFISGVQIARNHLYDRSRLTGLIVDYLESSPDPAEFGLRNLDYFVSLVDFGKTEDARRVWESQANSFDQLYPLAFQKADAKYWYAWLCYCEDALTQEVLHEARIAALESKRRVMTRALHWLEGDWCIDQGRWQEASQVFAEAIRMAREAGLFDFGSELSWTLAQLKLGTLEDPLAAVKDLDSRASLGNFRLAQFWQTLGNIERAKEHAIEYYRWAWADGDPYHRRWEFDHSLKLLAELGVDPPELPAFDPSKATIFPWEATVREVIEKQKAEKAERERKRAEAIARGEGPDSIEDDDDIDD